MKKIKKNLILFVLLILASVNIIARESNYPSSLKQQLVETVMAGCTPGVSQSDIAINNVRARIFTSGDMWWNLVAGAGGVAQYEIPKGGGVSSLFGGAIWVGGIDGGGNLRVAAMTYRQSGNDFWPGPLDTNTVDISASDCAAWDKHFVITLDEVEDFVNNGTITQNIINWPGNGPLGSAKAQSLAPFFDKNGNNIYEPDQGDYPKYSMASKRFSCEERQIYGDKTIWWVFNDKGNVHNQSNGLSIGLEVRAQAFAFEATDEINNMTFYDYEIINRSSNIINKTYFGMWVDADLGCSQDDYVGCDVGKGLGYCYNGQAVDNPCQGSVGYGINPPAVGVDFFRGPKVNKVKFPLDGLDLNGVSFVEPNGRIGMAKFVYYNNVAGVQGEPTTAQHHYNYLSGFWQDNTAFTYGGTAKGGSVICNFMFPGDSDPTGRGTNNNPQPPWTEGTSGNVPADRRFLQSAGPFTLEPGAVNNVTIGAVWARATNGGPLASVQLMKNADIKAQALFNNCFQITNGPDAPDLTIQELDNQLIIYLTNKSTSNNYKESYKERDGFMGIPVSPALPGDTIYKFEGYQVYQIVDSTISVTDLNNPDKSRLVFQSDLKNGTGKIINYNLDPTYGSNVWVPKQMVDGVDAGVNNSFVVKEDLFAKGSNKNLVNHKSYYFMAIAYGFNNGEINLNPAASVINGFNVPYISSRKNIKPYVGIPHVVSPEANGTEQHSNYGDGVRLTRIEGQGNGGRMIDLISHDNILNSGIWSSTNPNGARAINITYERSKGPIDIKVIDPLNVPSGCFTIAISDSTKTGRWTLKNSVTGAIIAKSDSTLLLGAEQIIPELGLSIRASYVYDVAYPNAPGLSGVLEATMTFADPLKKWLQGLGDVDGTTVENWIRSGKTTTSPASPFDDYLAVDDAQDFEKILGGEWAPYRLCAYSDVQLTSTAGPAWDKLISNTDMRKTLASVDVVITSDKSKWTRCPVLELAEETVFSEGGARKMDLRTAPSVDKLGNKSNGAVSADPADPGYLAATGMGWFPGYAINIETGERLNMAFGEDSGLPLENGRDMIWNPTANEWSSGFFGSPLFGGKHYIYVFSHSADLTPFSSADLYLPNGPKSLPRYDGGLAIWQLLNTVKGTTSNNNYKKVVYADAMWVNIPLLEPGYTFKNPATDIPCDVNVRIRVARKFRRGFSGFYGTTATSQAVTDTISPNQNYNFPMYSFCTDDLQAHKGDGTIAKNALDLINVVPNPYYASSGYETSQSDNRIKITNLPEKCTVRMYSLNGTLIRTFKKDDPKTSLDWDLQNQARIPIASGLYLIHVDAPGVGEKILKWFGVMRPVDLESY